MRALVFDGPCDYAETTIWNTPRAADISEEDVMRGVHFERCRDCDGTGHFPVPAGYDGDDSCVACKATGLRGVSV